MWRYLLPGDGERSLRDTRLIPGTKRDGRAKGGDGRRERGETGWQGEADGCGAEERRAGVRRGGGGGSGLMRKELC